LDLTQKNWGSYVELFEIFAKGLKFKADFHSKMSVCRHELARGFNPPTPLPGNSNPAFTPTVAIWVQLQSILYQIGLNRHLQHIFTPGCQKLQMTA